MPGESQRVIKKSRNGCMRCKTKRIKCDETKPACAQCTKKKLRCPGFTQQLKWSRKYEIEKVAESSPQSSSLGDGVTEAEEEGQKLVVPPAEIEDLPTANDETVISPVNSYDAAPSSPETTTLSPKTGAITTPGYHPRFPPNPNRNSFSPSISANLVHVPSLLVEYYFDKVCIMFSTFDSPQNPFRTSIARLWPHSPAVFHAIQSMAAACLANDIPQMRMIGLQAQHDAINYLQQGLRTSMSASPVKEDAIFAIILLGLSTSWHDTQDLGLAYLHAARAVINSNLVSARNMENQQGLSADFLGGALVYWEMLAAMVSNDIELSVCNNDRISPLEPSSGPAEPPPTNTTIARIVPHPWTGVVPQTMKLFARTAKLIRRERIRAHMKAFPTALDLEERMVATIAAEALEEDLLSLEPPSLQDIVDPGDENTPLSHLLVVSDAYRCASLLMLYRAFPDILDKRLGPVAAAEEPEIAALFSSPLSPWGKDGDPATTAHPDPNTWLTSLASHILTSLRALPPTSGTRCIQPILFVIAASELRFSPPAPTSASLDQTITRLGFATNLTTRDVDVGRLRGFVEDRLAMFGRTLPRKPVGRVRELVREVWRRVDAGVGVGAGEEGEVFWMDVMIEMGWETIMG